MNRSTMKKKHATPNTVSVMGLEILDILHPTDTLPKGLLEDENNETNTNTNTNENQGQGGDEAPAIWAKQMMGGLKDMLGGGGADSSVDEDFDLLMSKLNNSPQDGKTTPQDHETMTRILHHFIEKISPMGGSGGDEDTEFAGMSEQEKRAARLTIN